ncbi:MAG: transcription antitermination factor NusB [Bryobacteraceae bacterium]
MPSRHKSRERALQVLFLADIRQQTAEVALGSYLESLAEEDTGGPVAPDEFMEQLVRGTLAQRDRIDAMIASHSEHWRVERMPVVDRNVLRMAVYEMAELGTPAPVVIDEALLLARRFSTEEAVAFINGVLDAIRKERVGPGP